jgi:hypothetical protein
VRTTHTCACHGARAACRPGGEYALCIEAFGTKTLCPPEADADAAEDGEDGEDGEVEEE